MQWPDRVWEQGSNGLWSSRAATRADCDRRDAEDALMNRAIDARRAKLLQEQMKRAAAVPATKPNGVQPLKNRAEHNRTKRKARSSGKAHAPLLTLVLALCSWAVVGALALALLGCATHVPRCRDGDTMCKALNSQTRSHSRGDRWIHINTPSGSTSVLINSTGVWAN